MSLSDQVPIRSVKRGPGRPPALTPDAIGQAVLSIGFQELTFAAVAEYLGVGQATLYRHAANRDELVRLGLDLALRNIEWPDLDGPWKPLLERWALAAWHAWEANPGAVLEMTRGVMSHSMAALFDQVCAALVDRGFTPRNAVLAADLVFDLAVDSRRSVEALDQRAASEPMSMRQVVERHWNNRPDSDSVTAQLRSEMANAIREDPELYFRGKLDVALAGIEQKLAPEGN